MTIGKDLLEISLQVESSGSWDNPLCPLDDERIGTPEGDDDEDFRKEEEIVNRIVSYFKDPQSSLRLRMLRCAQEGEVTYYFDEIIYDDETDYFFISKHLHDTFRPEDLFFFYDLEGLSVTWSPESYQSQTLKRFEKTLQELKDVVNMSYEKLTPQHQSFYQWVRRYLSNLTDHEQFKETLRILQEQFGSLEVDNGTIGSYFKGILMLLNTISSTTV